jgi:transglutaminase-like putative cysteine protease
LKRYLRPTSVIDHTHPLIKAKAKELCRRIDTPVDIAKACFEWVRDQIHHGAIEVESAVTCKATEVLKAGRGYCYAQAHLLAALLRANSIPAGFCYQRFRRDDDETRFCLHGLNAIYLPPYGWYRVDASEDTGSATARFEPPHECLPNCIQSGGEFDFPEIWPDPLPMVISILSRCKTNAQLAQYLPDIPIIPTVSCTGPVAPE